MHKKDILSQLYRAVIVSVQADPGDPLDRPLCILAMAQSALNGGARGLRLANPENIENVRASEPNVPIIGLTKPLEEIADKSNQVYITPTLWAAESVIKAGADIVAMDATLRPRPGGNIKDMVATLKERYPEAMLMADVSNAQEAQVAGSLGFDFISTTLSGYTTETLAKATTGEPDFDLLQRLAEMLPVPIVLEGRIWTPEQVERAFRSGAYAVVIGSAITRPQQITRRFVDAVPKVKRESSQASV